MKEQFFHPQSKELVDAFNDIARRHGSRQQVFSDFLHMSLCAHAGGRMEEEYLQVIAPYTAGTPGQRDIDRLARLFVRLVEIMEVTRADIRGGGFQAAITRGQAGQYLTPATVADCMAQMVGHDEQDSRIVTDPCCGSGRMLLAAAKVKRNHLFVGQDVDLRCVRITAINLALHNLYGYVIWGNSLRNERRLVYAMGFDGKGVVRVVPVTEADTLLGPASPPSPVPPPPRAHPTESPPIQRSLFDDVDA